MTEWNQASIEEWVTKRLTFDKRVLYPGRCWTEHDADGFILIEIGGEMLNSYWEYRSARTGPFSSWSLQSADDIIPDLDRYYVGEGDLR